MMEDIRTTQAKEEANQEEMKAKMHINHEKLMTIMKGGKEKIEAIREACLEVSLEGLVVKRN
jgi:hypothetical protein